MHSQMICGNTQAEMERDTGFVHTLDRSMESQELYGRSESVSEAFTAAELNDLKAEFDHVFKRLMAGEVVTDCKGLNHWLPAKINNLGWAKTLRKQLGEKGHSLLYAYKNGDLEDGHGKLILEEAAMLAYTVVRHE